MSWKPTGIWLATAAVLFAFIWLVERPIRQERLREISRAILPGLNPASIDHVEIKAHGTNEIQVERTDSVNNIWKMTRPLAYPAQSGPITALLNALAKLDWQERIAARELSGQADAQEKFGFSQAQFEIAVKNSRAAHKILIGQTSAMGDQVYVEVVGNPDIYLVDAALLQSVPADKDKWRDPALIDLSRLPGQSIQVRSPGRGTGFKLERNLTTHLWSMTEPVKARADTARVNELLMRLQGVRVRQFISDDPKADLEPYGLQISPQTPDLELSFWQGTNFTAALQVGAALTNQPDLAYARRTDPSNIVVVPREPFRAWQGDPTNFLDFHFISASPDSVGEITVQGQGETPFSVQKQNDGSWEVHAGTTFPADAILMRDWLASFTNIQTQIEKTVATDLSVYGLGHPLLQYVLRPASGTRDGTNDVIAQIEFGTNKSKNIFERRPDSTFVNLINREEFDRLPRAAWQLRDRGIWNFDSSNVVSLTIHQSGVTRKYLRDPLGEWTFAPGFHGPPEVNWLSLEEGIHRLGQLRAVYWDDVGTAHWEAYGFRQTDFNLSLELKHDGKIETNSIEFGARSPYSYPYAAVVENGQPLIFEFPVDLYDNFVDADMTIPAALRYHH